MTEATFAQFFKARRWRPFPFQKDVWSAFESGQSGLVHAPTGLGKTLAVYLGPLAAALQAATVTPGRVADERLRILWITPLRALANDTVRALREPIEAVGSKLTVEARTGDTSAALRARLRKRLPTTLVTTPESLSLMLTHAETRAQLDGLTCVIVDEWHELLGTKRGVQTELCLARLRRWLPDLRIWGLSATLGNLTEARQSLLGSAVAGSVEISADLEKPLVIETLIPTEIDRFPWSGHIGTKLAPNVAKLIDAANSTLLFTNTRSQTEIWVQVLRALRPEWGDQLGAHHGSIDREERQRIESGLREGKFKCVVATSSLDLGVDFSPVDQVIQVGSPKGVARLLQRAGRSGHQPGGVSRIVGVPTHAIELIEFAAARDAALARNIESRQPLEKPLDLLVQHLVTCAIGEPFTAAAMHAEITSTHAYRNFGPSEWAWALQFICSGGAALKAYPKFQKARLEGDHYVVDEKRLVAMHRLSIGTIISDPLVSLKFVHGRTLGTVEESFISKIPIGSNLVFGGQHLTLVRLQRNVATVRLAKKPTQGRIAIWGGSRMPLSSELAHALSDRLRGEGTPAPEMDAVAPVLEIQRRFSRIPDDRGLLVERAVVRDIESLFLYPFAGRLAHEGLAAVIAWRISSVTGEAILTTQNDYGFSLSAAGGLALDESALRGFLTPQDLLDDLLTCMNGAELSRRKFREIARVSGLVLQQLPSRAGNPQRELQISSSLLYEVLHRYDPGNLLLDQSRREILESQLEFTRLAGVLDRIATLPIHLVSLASLSPMAFPLWAERLSATLTAADAATQLEAMLARLDRQADALVNKVESCP